MKKLIVILFAVLFACGNPVKETSTKMVRLETQIDSLKSAARTALIRGNDDKPIVDKLTLLESEYKKLLEVQPWYLGRDLPCESILASIDKDYDLNNFDNFPPVDERTYTRMYSIVLPFKWNMQDANHIKDIVMKELKFEPETGKYQGETSKYLWTASKYDLELFKNANGGTTVHFSLKR